MALKKPLKMRPKLSCNALRLAIVVFCLVLPKAVIGQGIYQQPLDFLNEIFAGDVPTPERLWLTGELKIGVLAILEHDPAMLRVRFWRRNTRTAWILEEIGKERPITTGLVVDGGVLVDVKVLIFRESRGHEIRHPFFTEQFYGATLGTGMKLDRHIDGIAGATLSVRALTKLARLALLLDRHARKTQVGGENLMGLSAVGR